MIFTALIRAITAAIALIIAVVKAVTAIKIVKFGIAFADVTGNEVSDSSGYAGQRHDNCDDPKGFLLFHFKHLCT